MHTMNQINVLFIAGFEQIVRDSMASLRLYNEALNIPFREAT